MMLLRDFRLHCAVMSILKSVRYYVGKVSRDPAIASLVLLVSYIAEIPVTGDGILIDLL
jgi:hypothetical protein